MKIEGKLTTKQILVGLGTICLSCLFFIFLLFPFFRLAFFELPSLNSYEEIDIVIVLLFACIISIFKISFILTLIVSLSFYDSCFKKDNSKVLIDFDKRR